MKKNKKPSKNQTSTTTNGPTGRSGNKHGKELITDPRFAKVHTDPRFAKLSIHKAKVPIDSRFSEMFTDKRFGGSSAKIDKRGKLKVKEKGEENALKRYYRVEEEEEEKEKEEKLKKKKEEEEEEEESEDEEESESESMDSSSDSDTDVEEDLNVDDGGIDVEEDVPMIEKETHRLAVVNMDWDRVKAVDFLVGLNSFLPKGGRILSVSVYPSEFGLKRMEEEAVSGPGALLNGDQGSDDSDDSDDGDDEVDDAKLRAYERSRLRYYFAVVECDSTATADYLYRACDGLGFGGQDAYPLDLRFIPDAMEFKHEPRDVAKELPAGYEGLYTKTRGLQHTNILLSWDEDDPYRVRTLKRNFNADQLAELQLKEFLASDESEEDEDENGATKEDNPQSKYRALLQGNDDQVEDEDEGQDMEVTFSTGLEDLSKQVLEKKDRKSETTWEASMRKRREKKKAKKNRSGKSSDDDSDDTDQEPPDPQPDDFFEEEPPPKKTKVGRDKKEKQPLETEKEAEASKEELELLFADDNEGNNTVKGYKIKPRKAKGKKGKDALDEEKIPNIDYEDPRFAALFKNPLFALDPTDSQFKRSATYARQLAQQQQKGQEELAEEESRRVYVPTPLVSKDAAQDEDEGLKTDRPSKEKHELSALVKSIKMKSKHVPAPCSVKKKSK